MSDLPDDLAKLIVQATVPAHGPIVRIIYDIVLSDDDDGDGYMTLSRDICSLFEFVDNSVEAAPAPFPHDKLLKMLTGDSSGDMVPIMYQPNMLNGSASRTVFSMLRDFHGSGHTFSGQRGNQLVIVRTMSLVSAGTWRPTAAERALFDT